MKLKKGDFAKIDYVARIKSTGMIFDLTDEKTAKKENIYSEKAKYEPATIVIGARHLLKGLDDQLEGKETGKQYTITLAPEDGFGPRSGELIKVFPKNKFRDHKGPLYPGARVQIQGITGIVSSVSGGRVRVDFNHPLAGKELEYKVKIVGTVSSKKDQVNALLELHAPFPGLEAKVSEKTATISVPNRLPQQWLSVQTQVAKDILEHVGLSDVKFIQEYTKKDFEPPKPPKEAKEAKTGKKA